MQNFTQGFDQHNTSFSIRKYVEAVPSSSKSGNVISSKHSATAMDHQHINAVSAAALDAVIDAQATNLDAETPESTAAPSPMDDVQTSQHVGPTTKPGLQLLQTLEGHTDRVWAVAWSPDGA